MSVPKEITFRESGKLDIKAASNCWATGAFSMNPNAGTADDYLKEKAAIRIADRQREKSFPAS
jgi:hypothetical protein